jgi:hypothetical protein
MRPVETVPGMRGWGDKGEWWRGWIQLWYILRTFVNVTMYPQHNNNLIIKKRKMCLKSQCSCILGRKHVMWQHVFLCIAYMRVWLGTPSCYYKCQLLNHIKYLLTFPHVVNWKLGLGCSLYFSNSPQVVISCHRLQISY